MRTPASRARRRRSSTSSVDDWWPVLRVNLIGPFLAIKHAGRAMVAAGGGSILCTASVAGLRSGAGGTPYSASKAGVISLVQTAAYQLAGTGVRVNAICPGLIETGMTKPIYDGARAAGKEARIGQLNPLKRGGAAARDRGDGRLPRQRRRQLRERPGLRRGRRAQRLAPLRPGQAGLSAQREGGSARRGRGRAEGDGLQFVKLFDWTDLSHARRTTLQIEDRPLYGPSPSSRTGYGWWRDSFSSSGSSFFSNSFGSSLCMPVSDTITATFSRRANSRCPTTCRSARTRR